MDSLVTLQAEKLTRVALQEVAKAESDAKQSALAVQNTKIETLASHISAKGITKEDKDRMSIEQAAELKTYRTMQTNFGALEINFRLAEAAVKQVDTQINHILTVALEEEKGRKKEEESRQQRQKQKLDNQMKQKEISAKKRKKIVKGVALGAGAGALFLGLSYLSGGLGVADVAVDVWGI